MNSERDRREEELRREVARSRPTGSSNKPGVRRVSEYRVERVSDDDATRRAARQGTREALEEKEQESGGGGLYGSQIDASHLVGAAIAELVGTFILGPIVGGVLAALLYDRTMAETQGPG